MGGMVNDIPKKTHSKYVCECCDYYSSNKKDYNRHLMTAKHQMVTKGNYEVTPNLQCKCGKAYKHLSGLSRHKHSCTLSFNPPIEVLDDPTPVNVTDQIAPPPTMDASIVLELLKQNQEFKELIIEQNKQMMELAKNSGHNTINNTNCNNKFNLNVFLNETCKDAITMDDFINSIEVTREDFLHTGQVGFVEGISTVMAHRFRDMEMHTRPLHCTDLKRETIYIKNADKWEKDDADKTQMRKAVRSVAKKNMKELWRWYNDNKPAVEQIGTDVCEDYFQYHKAALGGYGKEEDLKFEEKIIKNVIKEVQVDKNALTSL